MHGWQWHTSYECLSPVQALEAENLELRDEVHALSDDLEAVVRENAAFAQRMAAAEAERDGWRDGAAEADMRVAAAKAAGRAKDSEIESMRKVYEVARHLPHLLSYDHTLSVNRWQSPVL